MSKDNVVSLQTPEAVSDPLTDLTRENSKSLVEAAVAAGVSAPKSRGRSGKVELFHSSLAPRYVRRCTSLDAAIPWLYLRGVSTGDMRGAVSALVEKVTVTPD